MVEVGLIDNEPGLTFSNLVKFRLMMT